MRNKAIERFYKSVKLEEVAKDVEESTITFVKVFHKEYPRFPVVELPEVVPEGEYDALLERRESYRDFSTEPIGLDELSKVLYTCRIVDRQREPERRTYPSAGARFPVEIYPVAFNVAGLERGAYHYNMQNHKLEVLLKEDLREREAEFSSPYLSNTAAALILTSVLARSEIKYGNKAYSYSLIEAGHIGQNLQLACAKYDIGCCPIGGFVNDSVSRILDLTEDEIPIYILCIGAKQNNDESSQDQ